LRQQNDVVLIITETTTLMANHTTSSPVECGDAG
jgi:hypothetical protein